MNYAVIVAGGTGSRMGLGFNKVFAELGGETVIARAVRAFQAAEAIDEILVVAGNPQAGSAEADCSRARELLGAEKFSKLRAVVPGGPSRMESVECGLRALTAEEDDIVLVHDGGRPFVTPQLIGSVAAAASRYGAAVCGISPKDTMQAIDAEGFVERTFDRSRLLAVHTPAAARWGLMKRARGKARAEGYFETPGFEDSALLALSGAQVKVVPSFAGNIKITTPEDLHSAEALLSAQMKD